MRRLADTIVDPLVLLLFSVAFLIFLWGIFEFVYKADDEGAREKGKQHLVYGIVGMVVMVAAYGIMQIIGSTARVLFGN